jgi:uncharacterized sporulation protein YeaH/YhbH (DUF444 family)
MQKEVKKRSHSSSSTSSSSSAKRRARSDPPSINTQRKQFQIKQRAIAEENPKYMKNSVATGRRARVRTKNPKLVYPTLRKTSRSKASVNRDEGDEDAEGFNDRRDSRFRRAERGTSPRSRSTREGGGSRPTQSKSKITRIKR